jgi:Kef-type K+ transport system membrane component KefB
MPHLDVPQFLGLLVVMLAAAKLCGALAQKIGQPAVLGELIAGVILGATVLHAAHPTGETLHVDNPEKDALHVVDAKNEVHLVDPKSEVLHLLAEMGVVILLFEIGLETDLKKLMKVGGESAVVAAVGVALPFALGYAVCHFLGLEPLVAVVSGATLTATSVGITARVLSDLNRLHEPESQIVLGAAVIDDVIGLVILAVVAGLAEGHEVTALGVARIAGLAFGFLAITLILGRLIVPPLVDRLASSRLLGSPTLLAIMVTLGLAWLASVAGSAVIIGAFAAGLLLRETTHAHEIEHGVAHLGHFFVPLFFITVGAAVELSVFNPFNSANHRTLLIGGLLTLAAIAGKFAAGYAPVWFKGNKRVIGVGMIPRGEVGLIFAQMGLVTAVFDTALFSAVALMVMITTFITPPLLKLLFSRGPDRKASEERRGSEELTTES